MTRDNIIIRMPENLEYFLPATALVHDYVMQQAKQIATGSRLYGDLRVKVELGHEEQFFFSAMFPRLELTLKGLEKLSRQDWDCLVDLRDVGTALSLAEVPQKHLTESWGVMVGSNPRRIPELGVMGAMVNRPILDVLIDEEFEGAEKLKGFFDSNYPILRVAVKQVNGLRACNMFMELGKTKMYVGMRSAATYLAAMMRRRLIELYPDDLPLWFMMKQLGKDYRVFYGNNFTAEMAWLGCEELLEERALVTA